MKAEPKHPRLTALKALSLIRKIGEAPDAFWLKEDVKNALEHHVASYLVRKRKK